MFGTGQVRPVPQEIEMTERMRLGVAVGGAFLLLLVILAVVRPEMMGMGMIRNLIVGFGL